MSDTTTTTAPATVAPVLTVLGITRTATGLFVRFVKASGVNEDVFMTLDTMPAIVLVVNAADTTLEANVSLPQGATFTQATLYVNSAPSNPAVQSIAQPVAATALTPLQVLTADIAAAMAKYKQSTGLA